MFSCIYFFEDSSLSVVGKNDRNLNVIDEEFKEKATVTMLWGKKVFNGVIIKIDESKEKISKFATQAYSRILKNLPQKPGKQVPQELFDFSLGFQLVSGKRARTQTERLQNETSSQTKKKKTNLATKVPKQHQDKKKAEESAMLTTHIQMSAMLDQFQHQGEANVVERQAETGVEKISTTGMGTGTVETEGETPAGMGTGQGTMRTGVGIPSGMGTGQGTMGTGVGIPSGMGTGQGTMGTGVGIPSGMGTGQGTMGTGVGMGTGQGTMGTGVGITSGMGTGQGTMGTGVGIPSGMGTGQGTMGTGVGIPSGMGTGQGTMGTGVGITSGMGTGQETMGTGVGIPSGMGTGQGTMGTGVGIPSGMGTGQGAMGTGVGIPSGMGIGQGTMGTGVGIPSGMGTGQGTMGTGVGIPSGMMGIAAMGTPTGMGTGPIGITEGIETGLETPIGTGIGTCASLRKDWTRMDGVGHQETSLLDTWSVITNEEMSQEFSNSTNLNSHSSVNIPVPSPEVLQFISMFNRPDVQQFFTSLAEYFRKNEVPSARNVNLEAGGDHDQPNQSFEASCHYIDMDTPAVTITSTPNKNETPTLRRSPRKKAESVNKALDESAAEKMPDLNATDDLLLKNHPDVKADQNRVRMAIKAARKSGKPGYTLCYNLLLSVFTIEEIASSRGQGLVKPKPGDLRPVLNQKKVAAIKDYCVRWCKKNEKAIPSGSEMNNAITEQVSNCRKKLKKLVQSA